MDSERLEIPIDAISQRQVGFRRCGKGGGIFSGGVCSGTLTKYCERMETWPSISWEMDFERLEIPTEAIALRLVGCFRCAKDGVIFLGGD